MENMDSKHTHTHTHIVDIEECDDRHPTHTNTNAKKSAEDAFWFQFSSTCIYSNENGLLNLYIAKIDYEVEGLVRW